MGALVDLPTRLNCHSCSCTIHNPAHPPCLCSTETPEGQACGLVKNLALMTYISVGCPSNPVLDFLSVSAGGGWWHYSIYSFRGMCQLNSCHFASWCLNLPPASPAWLRSGLRRTWRRSRPPWCPRPPRSLSTVGSGLGRLGWDGGLTVCTQTKQVWSPALARRPPRVVHMPVHHGMAQHLQPPTADWVACASAARHRRSARSAPARTPRYTLLLSPASPCHLSNAFFYLSSV